MTTLERAARALWTLDCKWVEDGYIQEGLPIPDKWANPWSESGYARQQRKRYTEQANAAVAAIEVPSEAMITAGIDAHKMSMDVHSLLLHSIICDIWRAMHKAMMEE